MKGTILKSNGFTLIEVIVTISIFTLILFGIVLLVTSVLQDSGFQQRILDNNDQARKLATTFTNEMRNAVTSATGSYVIGEASDQQIIFFTQTSTTVNRIRYYLSGGKLYKGVTIPTGTPPTYNLANETVEVVQSAMATGVGEVIFKYYDSDYTGGVGQNPLTQPVNLTQIRYVTMDLKIYLQGSRNNINTYTVRAGASIRNLKDNL